jgi:hypothetical protein
MRDGRLSAASRAIVVRSCNLLIEGVLPRRLTFKSYIPQTGDSPLLRFPLPRAYDQDGNEIVTMTPNGLSSANLSSHGNSSGIYSSTIMSSSHVDGSGSLFNSTSVTQTEEAQRNQHQGPFGSSNIHLPFSSTVPLTAPVSNIGQRTLSSQQLQQQHESTSSSIPTECCSKSAESDSIPPPTSISPNNQFSPESSIVENNSTTTNSFPSSSSTAFPPSSTSSIPTQKTASESSSKFSPIPDSWLEEYNYIGNLH